MTDAPDLAAAPEPPLDRGVSPITGRFGLGRPGQAGAVIALAAGCGLFLLATARHPHARPTERPAPARQVVAFEPAPAPTLANPGPDAPSLTAAPAGAPAPDAVASLPVAATPPSASRSPDAPLLAYSRGEVLPAAGPAAAALAVGPPAPVRVAGSVATARATRLPDRRFLILAGTSIPCVLQTAMDSATPGLVSCLIPADVWSDDGSVVLLEKGARVLGSYSGGLRQGQGRLFVAWTRAVTPAGVAIDLASPATDALGRAGFDGDIDRHVWSRFGGAILFSVLDGGLGALGRAGGAVNIQAPSTTATAALQGAADIAPTLRKPAGAEVAILVARDLDFSGVYGVVTR